MEFHLHHTHIFASDVEASIRFYEELFDARVVLDTELHGVRNVFMWIGNGRLHLYDQPPKNPVRGNIHHFGIQTTDIEGAVARLRARGVPLRREITDLGAWKYVMVLAPDDVLIELFEVNKMAIPLEYIDFFE